MQHNDDGSQPSEDGEGHVVTFAPSTLLPAVLHRLGLKPAPDLTPLDEGQALVALSDSEWYVRAAAARKLGKSGKQALPDSLLGAMEDEHEIVRAVAIHAASSFGEHVPVEKIVSALQDPAWHVREVAALTLGRLGQRVSAGPLLAALDDPVSPVREAARSALKQAHPDLVFEIEPAVEELSPIQPSSSGVQAPAIQLQPQFWQREGRKEPVHLPVPKVQRERQQRMKTIGARFQFGKPLLASLSMVATVVCLCVLVGSLLLTLSLVQRSRNASNANGGSNLHLYVTRQNTIYKVDLGSGAVIWKYTVTDYIHNGGEPQNQELIANPLTVADGMVYFRAQNHTLYALNASSGVLSWRKVIDYGIGVPKVVNGVIYVDADVVLNGGHTEYGKVYALNTGDGSERWHYQTQAFSGVGAVQNGMVYVIDSNHLEALNAATGNLQWSTQVPGWNTFDVPQVVDGILYMQSLEMRDHHSVAGYEYAFNPANGALLWRSQRVNGDVISQPTIADGVMYFGSSNGSVYALSAKSGQYLWSSKVGVFVYSSPEEVNGVVYVAETNGTNFGNHVLALNAAKGVVRWSKVIENYLADTMAPLVIKNGLIYVGTMTNVYALNTASGSVVKSYQVGSVFTLGLVPILAP